MAIYLYSLACLLSIPSLVLSQGIASNAHLFTSISYSSKVFNTGIHPAQFEKNIGRQVNLCAKIYDAKWISMQENTIRLQVGGEYINERNEVTVRLQEEVAMPPGIQKLFCNKNVCVNGTIIDHYGQVELMVVNTDAEQLLKEATNAAIEKTKVDITGQKLKLLSNAYLLEGPAWKAPVVTHLKAGSIILAEKVSRKWTYVKVIEKYGAISNEVFEGYISNKMLGIGNSSKISL